MSRLRRELYRLPNQGKVAGVCAGIAQHFGYEVWLVRIVAISGLLLSFTGGFFFAAYIGAWFILDIKPGSEKNAKQANKNRRNHQWREEDYKDPRQDSQFRSHADNGPIEVKEKVWQAGELPKQAVHDIVGQYKDLEKRLQNLETYVTSPEFTVAREINKL